MDGKLSEQYGQLTDDERMKRRLGVVRTKKTATVTHGPQIPVDVMAELQAKQNKKHLGIPDGTVLADGGQNTEPKGNRHFTLATSDSESLKDKEDLDLGLANSLEPTSEEDSLEQLPSDYINEGSRFRRAKPLNLEKITLKQLIELKLATSTKDRKFSIDQMGKKMGFTLAQRRLREQLQNALIHLARKEVCGESEAEALLKAYNNACKKVYEKQITQIKELFLRVAKNAYEKDELKLVDQYELAQLLDSNLIRLFAETQAPLNNTKLVEASSLKECVASERQFKKDKLSAILSGLEEMAKNGNVEAKEKLQKYKINTRFSGEVERLKNFGKVYLATHREKFSLSEALEILAKQVAYTGNDILKKMIREHICNKESCELSSDMRQGFALAIVKKIIEEDKTTTAKKVWFIQGAPQYNAGIKAIFDRHKNDKFDTKNIQALADEVSAFLRDAVQHYQAKPSDDRYSRKLRMWGNETAKNDAIITSLQLLLSLVEKTHPAYVPTAADVELFSAQNESIDEFVMVSASQSAIDMNGSAMLTVSGRDVSEIKRRASEDSFDSHRGSSEGHSIVEDCSVSNDNTEESADDEVGETIEDGKLLDFSPLAHIDNRSSTQVAYSSPSPTGSE